MEKNISQWLFFFYLLDKETSFLEKIVTQAEKWSHNDNCKWRKPWWDTGPPSASQSKCSFLWICHYELLKSGQIYCVDDSEQLEDKRTFWKQGSFLAIVLHSNACPYVVIMELWFEILPHVIFEACQKSIQLFEYFQNWLHGLI